MNNTKMKDIILKRKWFQTKDLHTLIIRVQDFFNINLGDLQEQLFELEEIAYKNIPKKPTPNGDDTNYRCPNCTRCMLTANNKQPYCMYCGQALKWD